METLVSLHYKKGLVCPLSTTYLVLNLNIS